MPDYSLLQEFLDENQHRQFPLDDSMRGLDVTGSFALPASFMVDMFLCAPPATNTAKYYVKGVVVRRYTVDVEIGYDGAGAELTVGRFTKIPHDAALNSVYYLEPEAQAQAANLPFTIMTGTLVVGSMEAVLRSPGAWSFQSSETAVLATRVQVGLAGVYGILLGGDIFSGNVAFKEGTGIRLTPSYDPGLQQTVITVSADLGGLEELQAPLTSDAAIMQNLVSLYGTPVTSINGIKPDANGNFTLQPLDCTTLNAITNGLSIENPCSLPCCDKSTLDDAYESISQLNQRYARMEGYYQSIGRNVNDLQSRMIALEI